MSLQEQLLDLTSRLHVAENEICPQIDKTRAQLQAVNAQYNKLRGRQPNLWLQSAIIMVALFFVLMPLAFVLKDVLDEQAFVWLTVVMIAATAGIVVLNIVRAKAICSMRKKRADVWWGNTGKEQALAISNSIENMRRSMYEYVAENPLLQHIPDCWWSESDCAALYKIVLQRRAASLEEAMAVYDDILEAEHQREMDREERRRAVAEITRRQDELQKSMDRAERDRIWANFALEDIRYHIKYDD